MENQKKAFVAENYIVPCGCAGKWKKTFYVNKKNITNFYIPNFPRARIKSKLRLIMDIWHFAVLTSSEKKTKIISQNLMNLPETWARSMGRKPEVRGKKGS